MKKNKSDGRLFTLLAKNYIAFSLVIFLIAAGVYFLWSHYYNMVYQIADLEKFISDKNIAAEKYEKVKTEKLLGTDGAFAVLNEDAKIIYKSNLDFDTFFTADEMLCITDYGNAGYSECVEFTSDDGKPRYLIIESGAYDDVKEGDGVTILDENFQVISGRLQNGKTSLTSREFGLMTDSYPEDFDIYKYSMETAKGRPVTILFRTKKWDFSAFDEALSAGDKILLLFIPLYGAAVICFILWLNRRIKKPLRRLDKAIESLAAGGDERVGQCGGPIEIQQIGENFDKLADRLAASEAERKRLDEQRQKLIADISHDLKTPITVIAGYTKAIRDGKIPPEEMNRYLEAIDSKAEALTELVNTFHEFSKVEHPEFSLSSRETDICEFMRGYLADKYDEIELAGFCLEADIPEEKIFCRLDSYQFKRALDNIFSNSLRYNTLGTILSVNVMADRALIRISIADNGIGIPENIAKSIFEPFVTGDESRSGKGSGLGLSITEHIVEAHGGKVRLCIPPAKGFSTEFEILLTGIK